MKYTITVNYGDYAQGLFDTFKSAVLIWYYYENEDDPLLMQKMIHSYKQEYGHFPTMEELYGENDSSYRIMEVYI